MALNHYPQEKHQHRFLARQYCCSKLETLVSEVASDAGTCMLMVGRSGDLRGITQPHWVALYGLLGNTRLTPYDQKRREAGRPVWADMARWMAASCCVGSLGRPVRVSRRSKRPLDARRMQRTHERRRSCTRDVEGREGTRRSGIDEWDFFD